MHSLCRRIAAARDHRPPVLAGVMVVALVTGVLATPALGELRSVSKRMSRRTGFPKWYRDATGLRVKLCVDNRLCLGGDPRPDRSKPASVHTGNLPDEAFYAAARAETHLRRAPESRIRWRAVLEAAFSSERVKDGRQVVFTRTQVVGQDIPLRKYPAGTRLRFETPYGTTFARVLEDGTLKRRKESRLGRPRNDFMFPVLETRTGYGPKFLRWDSDRPRGFLGNPHRLHTVTGGRTGNTFQVFEGRDPVSRLIKRFEVAGECFRERC